MSNYASEEYNSCKEWVAAKIQEGFTWEDVKNLCVSPDQVEAEFDNLRYVTLEIPYTMELVDWRAFIAEIEGDYSPIVDMYGISAEGNSNTLPVPTDFGSAWVRYKNNLLGTYTGKPKMSDAAVSLVEKNSHWILNHIKRDTRAAGAVKGLVMGSVQSGKTANMIGLVSMAAHYDWNFIIVLSGTIDNLRKQTRDRFYDDLTQSGGVSWHILDHTSNPDYMVDIKSGDRLLLENLKLNSFQDGKSEGTWMHRYVTVCLKNSTRLRNLIKWLQARPQRAAKLRILVIDDEADQASVNTRKMGADMDEDELERTAVNQLIIDLVNGRDHEGAPSKAPFQAMNYISFTATPYANVLNEAYETSLYPKSFICSLPESNEYFGARAIFGSKEDGVHTGLNIIREVPTTEIKELKELHGGKAGTIPNEFKKALAWFLCSAAILRLRGHKKSISMLIHTTALQTGHFEEYEVLKAWLHRETANGSVLKLCRSVYEIEKDTFTVEDLAEGYPDYGRLAKVNPNFPDFEEIEPEIKLLLSNVENIMMGEDKQPEYHENGIHLCVDNAPGIEHPVASTILATGGSGKERNLIQQHKDGVAGKMLPTKKTGLNSEGIRVMTPTEWGRLQGFIGYAFLDKEGNETFSFPKDTTRTQQYKQFGNSVTIPVIEEMAHFMLSCFDKMENCHEEVILNIAQEKELFNKRDIIDALHISVNHASWLLRKLTQAGKIEIVHRGRYSKYRKAASTNQNESLVDSNVI